jgi:FkbM family methyltransferase
MLFRFGYLFVNLSKRIRPTEKQEDESLVTASKLVQAEPGRSLFETPDCLRFWLSEQSTIDRAIIQGGVWEERSTALIRDLIKPGYVVLDVGANIGYYTNVIARLVGPDGHVHAFEPTTRFVQVLKRNVAENGFENVSVHEYGLSDRESELAIHINNSTASLHMDTSAGGTSSETARFFPLDGIAPLLGLNRLDFVKIDVDGHEPQFLRGAEETLMRFRPRVLLEVNHTDYLAAGVTAWDFYDYVKGLGARITNVDTKKLIETKGDFLKQCGNFGWQVAMDVAFSRNILLSFD